MNKFLFIFIVLGSTLPPSLSLAGNNSTKISAKDYQRLMIEHNLGVEVTMPYLLQQPDVQALSGMSQLNEHLDLIRAIAQRHDWAKINQRPEFLKRFSVTGSAPISQQLAKFYGISLNQETPQQKQGLAVVKVVNQIDHALFEETIRHYFENKQIPIENQEALLQALKRLERMADLINRKMHETILLQRFKASGKLESQFVFEFGHHFDLKTYNSKFWDNNPEDYKIAAQYSLNPDLMHIFKKAISEKAIATRMLYFTTNSPYGACRGALL